MTGAEIENCMIVDYFNLARSKTKIPFTKAEKYFLFSDGFICLSIKNKDHDVEHIYEMTNVKIYFSSRCLS